MSYFSHLHNHQQLVRPEQSNKIEHHIVSMAMSGQLSEVVNEIKLIEILESLCSRKKVTLSTIHIQRKKYSFDSDTEEDDNDLL